MKKKLLNSMRVLLVAAGLCVGAGSVWADKTYMTSMTGLLGLEDNSTPAWTYYSKTLTIKAGETYAYTFTNYTLGSSATAEYQTWIAEIREETTGYCLDARGDGGGWTWDDSSSTLNYSYSGKAWNDGDRTLSDFMTSYNGVPVTLTISCSNDGKTVTIARSATLSDNTTDYSGTWTCSNFAGNDKTINLIAEASHINITNVVYTNASGVVTHYDLVNVDLSKFDSYFSGSYSDGTATFTNSGSSKVWAKMALSDYFEGISGTVTNVNMKFKENVGGGGRITIGIYGNDKSSWATNAYQDTGNSVSVWGIVGSSYTRRIYYGSTNVGGVLTYDAEAAIEVDMDIINKKFTWIQDGTTRVNNQAFVDTEITLPQYLALYSWSATNTTTLADMTMEIVYIEASYYTATFTDNTSSTDVTSGTTIYTDSERTDEISNGLLEDGKTYYYTATKTNYYDYEGSFTVDGADPAVNFSMTIKPSYTINAVSGSTTVKTIVTGYTVPDATYSAYVPKAVLYDGKYYLLDDGSNTNLTGYYASYTMGNEGNEVKEINYILDESVKAFWEGESMSNVGHSFYNTRSDLSAASGGKVVTPYSGTSNGIRTNSTIAQGVYNISIAVNRWGDSETSYNFQYSTDNANWTDIETVTFASTSNETHVSENVQIPSDSYLRLMSPGGTPRHSIDYILVQKVGELVAFTLGAESGDSYKSYVTTGNTDFATLGVTAYIAKAADTANGTVTLSTIDTAPANTPVLLKGTQGDNAIISTTTTSYSAPVTNYLVAADGSTAIGASEAKYVLAYNSGWEFRHYNGTLSAGKVYLDLSDLGVEAARLTFIFDGETTGIDSANNEETKVKSYYNLNGQRVNQPVKGLYIVRSGEGRLQGKNGKKVIIK